MLTHMQDHMMNIKKSEKPDTEKELFLAKSDYLALIPLHIPKKKKERRHHEMHIKEEQQTQECAVKKKRNS